MLQRCADVGKVWKRRFQHHTWYLHLARWVRRLLLSLP